MSISEELPREITKDANVTGTPEPAPESGRAGEAASLDEAGAGDGAAGLSAPLVPRRSRTTNPSSFSPPTALSSTQPNFRISLSPGCSKRQPVRPQQARRRG